MSKCYLSSELSSEAQVSLALASIEVLIHLIQLIQVSYYALYFYNYGHNYNIIKYLIVLKIIFLNKKWIGVFVGDLV